MRKIFSSKRRPGEPWQICTSGWVREWAGSEEGRWPLFKVDNLQRAVTVEIILGRCG